MEHFRARVHLFDRNISISNALPKSFGRRLTQA